MSVKAKRKTKAIVPRIKLWGIKSNKNAMDITSTMREQTNKKTSHAGKTNILKCPRDKSQQQSNKKHRP